MIVITMTSWKKRINNCFDIVKMIMKNTIKPDMLYLNLSDDEFKNKENDLPANIVEECKTNKRFIINWISGKNTKSMKKLIPILDKLDDDDIIIPIDDDFEYPIDFIEKRLDDFKKYNYQYAITGAQSTKSLNDSKSIFFKQFSCGASSTTIYKKKMLNNLHKLIDNQTLSSYHDDGLYTIILYLNGYKFKKCSTYPVWTDKFYKGTKLKKFNEIDGLSKTKSHWSTNQLVKYVMKEILEKSYGKRNDWFGYFKMLEDPTYNPILLNTPQPDIPKNSKSKLSQIKEDIKNGKLKKVFIDGKYTWKRYE